MLSSLGTRIGSLNCVWNLPLRSKAISVDRVLQASCFSSDSTPVHLKHLNSITQRPTLPENSPLRRIDYTALKIERTKQPFEFPNVSVAPFGEHFSDHILEV